MTATSTCSITCTQTSFQDLIVTLPAINGSAQFIVSVTNVRNPPSYRPSAGFFNATTKTSD